MLQVWSQYLLPKLALTRLAGRFAGWRGGRTTHAAIRRFIVRYGVDMGEAADPVVENYPTFNEFFTRPLKPGARPLAPARWVCPVDGAISQFGAIEGDRIFQAKGHDYTTQALVGGDADMAARYQGGHFATIYLSPRDYHRIHMPCAGRLRRMVHVPGELYSVNPVTAQAIPGLFARNERVVAIFDTDIGPMAVVLVGAMIVASIETVWAGLVTPPKRQLRITNYQPHSNVIELARGDEMGRFKLGSTAIVLFGPNVVKWNDTLFEGTHTRMGEQIGELIN